MKRTEYDAAERQLTLVCLRNHIQWVEVSEGIRALATNPELVPGRCPHCGSFWHYATDGQKKVTLVADLKTDVVERPEFDDDRTDTGHIADQH